MELVATTTKRAPPKTKTPTYLVRLPSIYEIIRYPLEVFALALDIKALVARYQLEGTRDTWRHILASGIINHNMHWHLQD